MENNNNKKKRLVIEVNDELHYEIKTRALKKNITVRAWVLREILQAIKREQEYE